MADLLRWFRDRKEDVQGAYHQVNPFDGGRTFDTNRRNVQPGVQAPNLPQGQPQQDRRNVFQKTWDQVNPADQNRTWRQQAPVGDNRNAIQQVVPQISRVGKTLGDSFGVNTAIDSARWAAGRVTGNEAAENAAEDRLAQNVPAVLPIAIAEGFKPFAQSVATAALTPYQNRVNEQSAEYEREILGKALNVLPDGSMNPNAAINDAQVAAYSADRDAAILEDALVRAGIDLDDPTSTVARKVSGQGLQTATNIVTAGQLPGLGQAVLKTAPVFGALGGIDSVARTMQQDDPSLGDYLEPGLQAAAMGAALPIAFKGGQKALEGVTQLPSSLDDAAMRHPAVMELDNTMARLNQQRGQMLELGMPETAPALRANAKAYQSALLEKNNVMKQVTEGGYVGLPGKKSAPVPDDPRAVLPQIAEKRAKGTRFTEKTVQGSAEVSKDVKKLVKESDTNYTPTTNKAQAEASTAYLRKTGIRKATTDVKERLNAKNLDDQTVSDSIAVAKKLDEKGGASNHLAASEIYEQLGEKLTKAGQTVQAASLLTNRTPQGLKYGAINTLRKEGVKMTPQVQKQLDDLVAGVKNAKPGSYEDGLARHNLAEFVSKQVPSRATSKGLQIWKAGLLTAPSTTAGNLAANTAESVFKKGYVDPLANMVDGLFSVFTGQRSRSYTLRGLGSGAAEGAVKGVKYFKTGYDPRNPNQKFDIRDIHYSDTKLGRAAETYTQSVFKLMGSQDQPFYYANLRNSIADQAITAAKNQGLKGAERTAFIKKAITEPTKDVLQLADKEARYAVFQNETTLGKTASRLKGSEGITGDIAEFVVPFSGVPSSIATRVIERTPIGTAHEIIKQIKNKKFDQRAMTNAISNGSAAIPLIGAGYALASKGLMTTGYPQDRTERELWEAEGKQPYSIKVGDTWVSLNYFQPAGTLIAGGAEYKKAIDEGKSSTEALAAATASTGKALTDQSFLKGVSGSINAIVDPQTAGDRFIDQTVGSVVPNFIRSTARATDDKDRQVNTYMDRFKSAIPGARQTLPVKKDMFGRDVERRSDTINSLINPLRPSDVKNKGDATQAEIRRLQDVDEGITPTQIKKDAFMKDGKGDKLSDKQVQDFNAEVGAAVKTEWDKMISSDKYKGLSDSDKREALDDINRTVYEAKKKEFSAKNQLGEYSPTYDGEQTKLSTNAKRYAEGKDIDYLSEDSTDRTPQEEYEYQLERYNEKKGEMSEIERMKEEKSLKRLEINKDMDPKVVDLYSLNKDEVYNYVTKKKGGKKLFDQLVKYGDKLVDEGLLKYNKFRDSKGNISLKKPGSKGGRGRGGKSKKPWQAPSGGGISRVAAAKDARRIITGAKVSNPKRLRRKF